MISGLHGNVNATVRPAFGWQNNVVTKDQYPHENWTQWPPQPSLVHRLNISTCNPAVLQTRLYKLLFICSVHVPPVHNTWMEYVSYKYCRGHVTVISSRRWRQRG